MKPKSTVTNTKRNQMIGAMLIEIYLVASRNCIILFEPSCMFFLAIQVLIVFDIFHFELA